MATSVEARTVSASAKPASLVDIKSLVLLAILLAAGFILNMTLGCALGIVGTVLMGAELATAVVKVPIVLGTAVFNAIVVQALYFPLKKVLGN